MSSSVQSESGKARRCSPGTHGALVELPQLGALALGVPLTEGVAEGEHPLLGPGLVLVPTGPAEGGVEPVGVDGVEQGGRLQAVAHAARARVGHPALVDRFLDAGHEQPGPDRLHLGVPVGEDLGEVVARVDVHDRERDPARGECLGRQVEQHGRVLAPAKKEDRTLRFGRHLADDEDGQRLEEIEVPEGVFDRPDQGRHGCAAPLRAVGGGAGLGWAEGGSGVHGTSRFMTCLVIYTNARIRTCVKRRRRATGARSPQIAPLA